MIQRKAELKRLIVGCRSYRRFQLETIFTAKFALLTGIRPMGFIAIDLLSANEWEARVNNSRRPEVESALVRYDSKTWLFSRCDGKGSRSGAAAPKERSGLWTRDPLTHSRGKLADLLPLLEEVWQGQKILATNDNAQRQRSYVTNGGVKVSESLYTKRRPSKFFVDTDGRKLFAPPYSLPQNGNGIEDTPQNGEGGTFSGLFTSDISALFTGMQVGIAKIYRYKLDMEIKLAELNVSSNARAIASRWKSPLKLTVYDFRRAKSTSVLAALDAARAWRAAGGGETIVHALREIVDNSLRLSDHGEQVARSFYLQTTPAESSQLLEDAMKIMSDGPSKFAVLDFTGDVEKQCKLSHRMVGWRTMARLAREGKILWAPVPPESPSSCWRWSWMLVVVVVLVAVIKNKIL